MEKNDLFQDIAARTGGDIYIGVVGPARAGKSTFIRRFMELLILPGIEDGPEREDFLHELPQSGAGNEIMTREFKFVPQEAVELSLKDGEVLRLQMVDCLGYCVDETQGQGVDGTPILVRTPWHEEEISFQDAAEEGLERVITEHVTMGLAITTDGTVGEIGRENYVEAEEKIIVKMQEIDKPYVLILNSVLPDAPETMALAAELEGRYLVPVLPMDVNGLTMEDVHTTLKEILYEFPVGEVSMDLPTWVEGLENDHWLRQGFARAFEETMSQVKRMRDGAKAAQVLLEYEFVRNAILTALNLANGMVKIRVVPRENLLYRVMEEITGTRLADDADLLMVLREFTFAKREYDKIADALQDVERTGYGIVQPRLDEMILEEPELVRRGNRFGVRLRASAPSLHMIRADINAEVSPIVGTEKQCAELVQYLSEEFEDNPAKLWQTNIFGKSLHELVKDGIRNKLYRMPENAQEKLQETLQRIVNEGGGGLICIIL
ncbi:MAG: stage IV sporulation protein A [Firmicutes bacterium]|nr:stage IV sporulation protein A [Bacillota bacterium]